MLKNKYKYRMLLNFWKKKFLKYFKEKSIWKKKNKILKKKWIKFLNFLLKNNKMENYFLQQLKILSFFFVFIKNKLLINLLFGFNKFNIDTLIIILFDLRGDYNTFFFLIVIMLF
jgi:hypothetical protein